MPRIRRSLLARSAARVVALWHAAILCGAAPAVASAAACPAAIAPTPAREPGDLERALDAWGDWVEVRPGQRAWRPRDVDPRWLPYFRGCWRWDGQSWSWVTDEPWGDVTYHFGRWSFDAAYGWVWVPGLTWAPAWVAWLRDGSVVGWAPLPPEGVPTIATMTAWTFVRADDFQDSWIDAVAVARAEVPAILLRMHAPGTPWARSPRSRSAQDDRMAAR